MRTTRTAAHATLPIIASALFAASAHAQSNSCASPTAISGFGSVPFTTVGATTDGNADAACLFFNTSQIYNDVWYCWTAIQGGLVEVSTCGGTALDTKIAVYAGCGCPALNTTIACSDDDCSTQTKVQFGATAGTTYMLRLGAYFATATGSGTLTVGTVAPLVDVTNPVNGHRYIALSSSTWTSAQATAQLAGGNLVSIADQAENDFVQQNFGVINSVNQRLWIGFNDVANEGAFVWSDGSPVTFTNWSPGEPNNAGSGEDAAEMLGGSGAWNDMPDSGGTYAHIAVIEFGGSTPPPPNCPSDLSLDGIVSGADLGVLLGNWGQLGAAGDLDHDGLVTGADLGLLLGDWGACP